MTKNAIKLYNYIHESGEIEISREDLQHDLKLKKWDFVEAVHELKELDLIEVEEKPLMYGETNPVWRAK